MTSAYCGVCGRQYSECVCGIRPTERCLEHDRFVCDECKHIGKGRGPLMLSVSLNEWNAASERMKRLERVAEAAREWIPFAERVIAQGADLMPIEQLSRWEGVRACLETAHEPLTALQALDGNPADPKAPLSKGPNCARDAGEKERGA